MGLEPEHWLAEALLLRETTVGRAHGRPDRVITAVDVNYLAGGGGKVV
jgi:hypothetical protein